MNQGVQLVPLRCPNCASSLSGEKEGVFFYCGGCGSGFEMDKKDELLSVQVYFAGIGKEPKQFFPFWAFDARLDLRKRETGFNLFGSSKGLIRLFEERGAIRFYVPGFLEDVEAKKPAALQFTYDQPDLEYTDRRPQISGFVISQEDARKIADFLFLTSEIEQSDMLKNLDYGLHLDNPMIIVIGW